MKLFLLLAIILPLNAATKPVTINIGVDNQTSRPMACDMSPIERQGNTARYVVFIHCYWDDTENRIKQKMVSLSYPHENMTS